MDDVSVTRPAVKRSPPAFGHRRWTEDEEAYLMDKWGTVSIPGIAEHLNRTTLAVKQRASLLGLGAVLMGGDYITLNQLIIAFMGPGTPSYHEYYLTSWVKNRGLPVHMKKVRNCSFRVVYLDEFWKWAEKNRAFLDFSRMEPHALGMEPPWVQEQRRKDRQAFPLQRKDPWTREEDNRLLSLLRRHKYTWPELSEVLHRSEGAIQRRCRDLSLKERPVRNPDNKWTDEHLSTLADGIRHIDSYAIIAKRLGRSEKAVRGKVYTTYLTEDADKVRQMLGDGPWGSGAPAPTVKQGLFLSRHSTAVKKNLSALVTVLRYRINSLGYDPYWQRFMCMHWHDIRGCTVGCTDCDSCTQFKRIRPQYCARCGGTFIERKDNRFCPQCRTARKKQAQKHWARKHAGDK